MQLRWNAETYDLPTLIYLYALCEPGAVYHINFTMQAPVVVMSM